MNVGIRMIFRERPSSAVSNFTLGMEEEEEREGGRER